MDSFPKKPCKFCGKHGHFPYVCYQNPKNKERRFKGIAPNDKHKKAWLQTRKTWVRKNPPPIEGKYWECYLRIHPDCPRRISIHNYTLDHVVSRSRDPSKKYSMDNLRPACWLCNGLKGSRTVEALEAQYGVKIQ